MLEAASLSPVFSDTVQHPFGATCRTHQGVLGTSLADSEQWTRENFVAICEAVTQALMAGGELELGKAKVITEEGRKSVMAELATALEKGVLVPQVIWVARR